MIQSRADIKKSLGSEAPYFAPEQTIIYIATDGIRSSLQMFPTESELDLE